MGALRMPSCSMLATVQNAYRVNFELDKLQAKTDSALNVQTQSTSTQGSLLAYESVRIAAAGLLR